MAEFVLGDLGLRRAAVLYDRAVAYSRELAAAFAGSFEQIGGETTAVFSYTTDAPQADEALAKIVDSGAQVLFLPGYPRIVLAQGGELRRISPDVVLVGSDSWSGRMLSRHSEFRDSYYTDVWAAPASHQVSRSFVDAFRALHGRLPLAEAALAYDAVRMLAEAMQIARSTEPRRIQEALSSITSFEGVTGTLYFNGDQVHRSAVVMRITGVSEPVVVKEWHPR
jgi:branched-chain amino acid transport system substrate-binding protein